MALIYLLAALPFFAGGAAISIAISRLSAQVNAVYAADLLGAGAGCLLLMPALNRLGAPGAIVAAGGARGVAAILLRVSPSARGRLIAVAGVVAVAILGMAASPLGSVHRQHDQGTREPCGALQQVEFVLANRRLRSAVRRVVAERSLHRPAARDAI